MWLLAAASAAHSQSLDVSLDDAALAQQVRALFQRHCISCHGPQQQSAELRLDSKDAAQRGGLSRQPVVGGTVETNEILRRVKSPDDDYRMPRRKPALSAGDIELLEKWVQRGTPWPQPLKIERSLYDRVLDIAEHPLARYVYAGLAGFIAGWVLWRCRQRARKAMLDQTGAPRPIAALARVSFGWLFFSIAATWFFFAWRETRVLQQRIIDITPPANSELSWQTVLGDPAAVIHLDHPPALKHTYYRGNCERNPQLFNNGVYRTCSIHVAVCDPAGKDVAWNDRVPPRGLAIRFEIERAPHATPQLFDDQIMNGVFLSAQYFTGEPRPRKEPIHRLRTIEPNERWAAVIPIAPAGQADGVVAGRLYLFNGGPHETSDDGGPIAAQCHYGVEYRITINDGRIAEGSEVWANAILIAGAVQWPGRFDPRKIPFTEWFDHKPIPVITGKNTDDPTLLGVPEHRKK
jgi:hypothetical protein